MKLLCFGDSNTFGYDPCAYLGSRYAAEDRWVDILAEKTGWDVVNAGLNGREIPRRSFEVSAAQELIYRHNPDLTLIMLGTNDLLQGADPDTAASRMEAFLQQLPGSVHLIAPPPLTRGTWVESDPLVASSRLLGEAFRGVAERLQIPFSDSCQWDIALTFDGVHFTEAGHHTFAEHLMNALL